jgi:DNA mismatch repair protein MutS
MQERLKNIESYTPAMRQYIKIKSENPECILFFRLGDFYENYFEDAEICAKELEISLTSKSCGDGKRASMSGMPYHSYEPYLYKLIEKGYKVAIVEQLEDPKEAKGIVQRGVVRIVTKGTINEGINLNEKDNNFICAVAKKENIYDITFVDISTGEIFIANNFSLDEIINEILSQKPSEIILNTDLDNKVFSNLSISLNIQKSIYDNNETNSFIQNNFNNHNIIKSLHVIFNYIDDTQKRILTHFTDIKEIDKNFMKLDHFTIKNLELLENLHDKKKRGSLLWILDKTITASGGRLLKQWIQKPLINKKKIDDRLNAVEEFYKNVFLIEDIKQLLNNVCDLERIISKLSFGTINAKDLIALKKSLQSIPIIKSKLKDCNSSYIQNIINNFNDLTELYDLLEQSIDENAPMSLREGGIIRAGFNKELDYLKDIKNNSKEWLSNFEEKERQSTGINALKVVCSRQSYFIEVTKRNTDMIPSHYNRLQTLSNAERYTTDELVKKTEEILSSEDKEKELEYKIFIDIKNNIQSHILDIKNISNGFSVIDVLINFATISLSNRYCKPTILDNKQIFNITENRHPVAEKVMSDFISNDISLDESHNIMLITGPNASGKSTYMKSIAISVLMAQIGCYVPSSLCIFSIVDKVFTRIGSSDDILNGDSTFMLEMKEINQALTSATDNSLIIIDELGRGTSTEEGIAIARSVIEFIHNNINARSLIATHYHELTNLDNTLSKLENYSMKVYEDKDEVIFLHKMEKGKAGKSYGIYCAKICKLPEEIIENSYKYLNSKPIKKEITTVIDNTVIINEDIPKNIEKHEVEQLDLFNKSNDNKLLEKLSNIDLLNTTPLQAIQILSDLKNSQLLK